ncbi:phosphoethanolamine transferase [Thiofaba sp. EF100]|jgi:glucan phosphoethanolaminetransferase (alkaline phosphatase superfamily)|uniref:phosphoethanolamine transferase n=1 Tax=Thiofaba sp. EF100 TaxID=3121274 RepID=UPI0032216E90
MKTALLWLALLLTPNLVFCAIADDPVDAIIRSLPASLALVTALLAWTRRPAWVLRLLSPFYLLLPFELSYIIEFGQPTTPHILAVVSESNPIEAIEYLGLLPMLACSASGFVLFFTTLRLASKTPTIPPSRYLRWLALASLVPMVQYAWLEWDWAQKKPVFDAQAAQTSLESLMTTELASPLGATLSDSYPLGVIFRVRDYLAERVRLRAAGEQIKYWDFHPQRTLEVDADEVYVLVIGESSSPAHWGINGYERNTTPKLAATENLVSFRNVVSPFSATRLAVPIILTGKQDPFTHRAPLGQASVVSLFKQAGFKTYWISNQAPLGLHDSIIAVHAYEADKVLYTNGVDYTQQGNHDDALLPIFERFLQEPEQRKFFVVHLLGSHKAYAQRYPETYDQFRPSQKQDPSDERAETVTNTYDNTILFTDHILSKLIQQLQARPNSYAALTYVSDHGENIPQGACTTSGHGHDNEADFRVSALAWFSNSYRNAHPDIMKRLQERIDAPLYSAGVFHALADIAHIEHPAHDHRLSWVSEAFAPGPRWTLAVPDFDHAMRMEPCGKLKMP